MDQLPTSAKLKIFSLLSNSSPTTTTTNTTSNFNNKNDKQQSILASNILNQIYNQGYCCIDNFIENEEILQDASNEIDKLQELHILKQAAIGSGNAKLVTTSVRGDYHCWMNNEFFEKNNENQNLFNLVSEIRTIRKVLSNEFDLHLERDSIQVAVYPGQGTQYQKHADATPYFSQDRKVTCILYLNKQQCDGGNLKLFRCESSFFQKHELLFQLKNENEVIEIEPKWNRLIVFLSDIYHQVLPTNSIRKALSCWFYSPSILNIHEHLRQFIKVPIDEETETKEQQQATIFVSIASYRDSELQWTVKDLIEKAKYPNRIKIGICWQYDPQSDYQSCFSKHNYTNQSKDVEIREVHVHYNQARGPIYARHLIQQYCFQNEDFYFQIDSHMRFVQDWDTIIVSQLQQCEHQYRKGKCLLSTYPLGYELPNKIPNDKVLTVLCAKSFFVSEKIGEFGEYVMPRLCGRVILDSSSISKPFQSLFYAAGFHFSRGSQIKEVPVIPSDDNIESYDYLFFGEEFLFLKRLYYNSYRIFTPSQVILYHLWQRDYRATIFEDVKQQEKNVASCRELIEKVGYISNSNVKIVKIIDEDSKLDVNNSNSNNNNIVQEKKWKSCKYAMEQLHINNTTASETKNNHQWHQFKNFIGINFETKIIDKKARNGGSHLFEMKLL